MATSVWARVKDWLGKPSGDPPAGDALVELTRLPDRIDAERAVQDLHVAGINAALFAADASGWLPHVGAAQGHRIMVRADDLEAAAQLIADR